NGARRSAGVRARSAGLPIVPRTREGSLEGPASARFSDPDRRLGCARLQRLRKVLQSRLGRPSPRCERCDPASAAEVVAASVAARVGLLARGAPGAPTPDRLRALGQRRQHRAPQRVEDRAVAAEAGDRHAAEPLELAPPLVVSLEIAAIGGEIGEAERRAIRLSTCARGRRKPSAQAQARQRPLEKRDALLAHCSEACSRGRITRNVEPAFGWLSTSTRPPCASTMRRTTESPRPTPGATSGALRRNGAKRWRIASDRKSVG